MANTKFKLDSTEIAYPQVSRGIDWMDKNQPRWYNFVDEDLDMSSMDNCILCQVSGVDDYQIARDMLLENVSCDEKSNFMSPSTYLGFDLPLDYYNDLSNNWWRSADRLWKAAAKERFSGRFLNGLIDDKNS